MAVAAGVDVIDHGDEMDTECIERIVEAGTFVAPSIFFPTAFLQQMGTGLGFTDTMKMELDQALEVQEVLDPKDDEARLKLLANLSTALLSAGEPERVLTDVGKRAFELAESLGQRTTAAHIAETVTYALIYQHGSIAFTRPDHREWCERVGHGVDDGGRESHRRPRPDSIDYQQMML